MRKQLIAVLLVGIMATLTFTILLPASANTHDITGYDYGYNQAVSTGINPCYCECNHDKTQGDSDDSESGLGIEAYYCLVGYPQNPMFNGAHWMFEGEAGNDGTVSLTDYLFIDPCVNGNDHHDYNWYAAPYMQYGTPPGFPDEDYTIYYYFYDLPASMNPVYSVEGRSIQCFYETYNPWVSWSIEARTQNPYLDPYGEGWAYLSATWDHW